MKTILSLALSISLLSGVAAVAFGQTDTNKQKSAKKKKKGKKATDTTEKKAS